MLTNVADRVWVRRSEFCLTNSVIVAGQGGLLLVDPGVSGADMEDLADEIDRLDQPVVAGFSTHPHWDHVLWHPRFGSVPRLATAAGYAAGSERVERNRALAVGQDVDVPVDLLGLVEPMGGDGLSLLGRDIHVVEHRAHAPGHAALLVEDAGVLLAGDMLSDVEIPLFDPEGVDPAGDYLEAFDLLAAVAERVRVVVPGHGAVGTDIHDRLAQDRAYTLALLDGREPGDPRVGPDATYGTDWLPAAHERNRRLAASCG